jgi:sigma-70, region 4
MKISVKKAAETFELPIETVLYYAREVLRRPEMMINSFLSESELMVVKKRLIESGEYRKELYFLIEKGVEAKILSDTFSKRNSQLFLRWDELLSLRFGYKGKMKTLKAIGSIFGVSLERVRQAEGEIIRYLKHPKVGRILKERFDYEAYAPKINIFPESIALINFVNKDSNKNV